MAKKLRMGPACYHTLHMMPPMVAHEMNFFFEEGLHDEHGQRSYEIVPGGLAPFGFEKEVLPRAMFDKGMDIAMDVLPTTVMLAQRRGADLYIIAGWRNQSGGWLVGAPEIKEAAQLKGKRVGVRDLKSIQWRDLCGALVRPGLDPERDVTWVRGVFYGEVPEAIAEGRVDAGSTRDIDRAQALGLNLLDDMKSHYPEGRPDRIVAASGKVLEERPEMVKAYLRAMIRSYWFIRKQPDHLPYVLGLERRLHIESPNEEEQQWWRFGRSTPEAFAEMPFPYDGLPTGFQQYFEEQVAIGEIDEVGDSEKILYLTPVREAFQELAARPELQPELERAKEIATSLGY